MISASQLLATKDFLICTHLMNSSEMVLWLLEGIHLSIEADEEQLEKVMKVLCLKW